MDGSMESSHGGIQRMISGSGRYSYALNSKVQGLAIQRLRPILIDAINRFKLPSNNIVRVADFGCSVGPNTLTFANIISTAFSTNGATEIQYFFNDLPTNDFNTLFLQLPPLDLGLGGMGNYDAASAPSKRNQPDFFGSNFQLQQSTLDPRGSTKEMEGKIGSRLYYAVGVPGSHWERLFPSSSLHLMLSTNAVHWMSHFPKVIQDKTSTAYNKGQTIVDRRNPNALKACGDAFQANLQKFLIHRAIELAPGGLLVMLFRGRWTNLPPMEIGDQSLHPCMDFLMEAWEASWEDLISEGLINAELRDSFNMPLYHASIEEVHMALDKSNVFSIQKLELQEQAITLISEEVQKSFIENPELYGDLLSKYLRAAFGELVEGHIGRELTDVYYQRLKKNFAIRVPRTKDVWKKACGEFLIILVRK